VNRQAYVGLGIDAIWRSAAEDTALQVLVE